MDDLGRRARAIMREKNESLTENFGTIVQFLVDHEDLRPRKRVSKNSPRLDFENDLYLDWLADKYIKGRQPSGVPLPKTVPDPALNKVLSIGYSGYLDDLFASDDGDASVEELLEGLVEGHRIAMVAENIIGELLERYIDDVIEDDDWIWCAGEVVKKVDFIRKAPGRLNEHSQIDWESLQIKNRDNSENSSSSAIRKDTNIIKWTRTKSKTGKTCWETFPVKAGGTQLSESGFQDFIGRYFSE
ncbi:SinI family restriction endonuclease [Corynebacterium casei]|uniref:SinI family restriction endonuclease n=1 Tax=Corynebacterium casei TaxID=160386 RepID=UPI003F9932B6